MLRKRVPESRSRSNTGKERGVQQGSTVAVSTAEPIAPAPGHHVGPPGGANILVDNARFLNRGGEVMGLDASHEEPVRPGLDGGLETVGGYFVWGA